MWMIALTCAGSTLSPGPNRNWHCWDLGSRTFHRAKFELVLGQTERKIMKVSPMSDEFHDWLESCPVQWFRGEVSKDHVAYYFETPDEDEE